MDQALTDEELLRILDDSDFSEDEILDEIVALDLERDNENDTTVNDTAVEDEGNQLQPQQHPQDQQPQQPQPQQPQPQPQQPQPQQPRPMKWKVALMDNKEPEITDLPAVSEEPNGLLEDFFEYLNLDFFNLFAEQTNLYSVQQNNHNSVNTSVPELLKYTGIEILMGTFKLPQARMYWSRDGRIDVIADALPRDRYFQLRQNIHFADNTFPNRDDKLWKVRPIIEPIKKKCLELPRSSHLAVDEQMIPFAGRCPFRQYVPSKPNPLGLKNFVLAAPDGLLLDFLIYVGKGTVCDADLKDLGLGASVVKTLAETIPNTGTHVLYTDRFFTSVKLADYMLQKNIFITGTVMRNRLAGAQMKLKEDKSLRRGEWCELVREDGKVGVVSWKDNKAVTLLSTCVGSEPTTSCKRWSKEAKEKIDVNQPAIVNSYNRSMGGIDLCDRLLAYYRSNVRTRKWTVRFYNHFVDLVIVNCWLMYRRCCRVSGIPKTQVLPLISYRMRIARGLIGYGGAPPGVRFSRRIALPIHVTRRESESSDENNESSSDDVDEPQPKRSRKVVPQPVSEVRFDGVGHLPEYKNDKFASKCRNTGCKSRCRVQCVKCKIYLCIMKNNCFKKYHTK